MNKTIPCIVSLEDERVEMGGQVRKQKQTFENCNHRAECNLYNFKTKSLGLARFFSNGKMRKPNWNFIYIFCISNV